MPNKDEQPIEKPTTRRQPSAHVGQMVLYTDTGGNVAPAVVEFAGSGGVLNLHVFGDRGSQAFQQNVTFDGAGSAHSWRWMDE